MHRRNLLRLPGAATALSFVPREADAAVLFERAALPTLPPDPRAP